MADDRPFGTLPVVDVAPLRSTQAAGSTEVARQIEAACREHGFFYVTGHGVAPDLLARLTRFSFPFFFDPGFSAEIPPLPGRAAARGGSRTGRYGEGGQPRWDGQNLHAFSGTYGDYLLGKVSKVFPQLRQEVLTDEAP